jgi:hypothetical protein
MKNTICKRLYKCKCGTLNECYVWETELQKHKLKCNNCAKILTIKELNVKVKEYLTSIRTPTKNR